MKIIKEGSVRVDLVGGTLDLEPIALILKNVVTINMATSLKAKVELESTNDNTLCIYSSDYQKNYIFDAKELCDENFYANGALSSHFFKEMLFVVLICKSFGITQGIKLTLSSGAPAGSGLGGSSAMGVTLSQALLAFKSKAMNKNQIVQHTRKIEELILDRGVAGYQDYYPALYGGILALRPGIEMHKVEQCYSKEAAEFLEKNCVLVYSGLSRNSGINNWEVFKNFFDHKNDTNNDSNVLNTRAGLIKIADIAEKAYFALKSNDFHSLLELICSEGQYREKLFPGIVTSEMKSVDLECRKKFPTYKGMKICGAGGGGCFLLLGVSSEQVSKVISSFEMSILPLKISLPLETDPGLKVKTV
jgi:D-glycero-alpha-D-manno-heptose-7-phosphate kinase